MSRQTFERHSLSSSYKHIAILLTMPKSFVSVFVVVVVVVVCILFVLNNCPLVASFTGDSIGIRPFSSRNKVVHLSKSVLCQSYLHL
jgi:hypothetical protein